jgi:Ca2+-binding RTX toxin-like protein
MNGGAGDDTTVWNNGDGSDVMNGDDGVDRVETNLAAAAADEAALKMENGRLRFDRLNLVPFNLSISAEVFELNGLGGDDSLTTTADVVTPLVIDAGSGNDTIQGGSGSDSIDGGDGNDTIQVRENVADFVRGGVGADTATVDAVDAVAADVETVDRPQAQPAPAPKPGAGKAARTSTVKRGVASLKISCPTGVSECKGSVTLRTAKGRIKTLGKANYTLKAGQSKTLKIRLAKDAAKLAKNKKLTVNARITSGAGSAKTAKVALTFR